MKRKIVVDSSASLTRLPGMDYAQVPLSINAGDHVFVDNESLDVRQMLDVLRSYKGRIGTACPAPADWSEAFGDADEVFCVSITSTLSGSYNSAQIAAAEYMENHPSRRVMVVDSLSTGPEMTLIAERIHQLCDQECPFDVIEREISAYKARTHLLFCLRSLHNLSANGRVSPAVAALIGMLGIRLVGHASEQGDLSPTVKARGDRKALAAIVDYFVTRGFDGGRAIIDHCCNPEMAEAVAAAVSTKWPNADIRIREARGLCSYYAEEGGLMIGFEGKEGK